MKIIASNCWLLTLSSRSPESNPAVAAKVHSPKFRQIVAKLKKQVKTKTLVHQS
jgi:hypothetical protein